MTRDFSRLTRPHYPIPSFVQDELISRGLMDAYQSRPPYQQNDYIGWIARAKQKETKAWFSVQAGRRAEWIVDTLPQIKAWIEEH